MIPQTGRIAELIQAAFHGLLSCLPSQWASNIGSAGIRWNGWHNRPEIIKGARANLRRHRPEASDQQIDAMIDEFLDGVGRVAAEFAVMHRFIKEGRIGCVGLERFKTIAGTRPIIALCVHTGNWELFAPVFQDNGLVLNSIVQPPDNRFEARIIDKIRRQFGVVPLLPDRSGLRDAVRALKDNKIVSMFPDEARQGVQMGPLFGRPPHSQGNLAVAAKLARMTKASFAIGHCRRTEPCRFVLHFGEVFDLPDRPYGDLLADVEYLNAQIEPVILDNIPRWYFLDDKIGDIGGNVRD